MIINLEGILIIRLLGEYFNNIKQDSYNLMRVHVHYLFIYLN